MALPAWGPWWRRRCGLAAAPGRPAGPGGRGCSGRGGGRRAGGRGGGALAPALVALALVLEGCAQVVEPATPPVVPATAAEAAEVRQAPEPQEGAPPRRGPLRDLDAGSGGECGGEEGSCAAAAAAPTAAGVLPAAPSDEGTVRWQPKTLSVVLPCAGEGAFVLKTARAVAKSVPGGSGGGVLSEIVVVDDGSSPPVSSLLSKELRAELGIRIVRHKRSKGLIQAKSAGAAASSGDVIVFFDCHVAPQPGWHSQFLEAMAENYRRIVVPAITDLDVDTWEQRSNQVAVSKCYLTWDADFKWFQSSTRHIPILSGGLLGISRRWWTETGGYDEQMVNWGGENIDQSLRTWLCGGEIVALPQAEVAHMWRKEEDVRTQANYHVDVMSVLQNRARAAKGWYGNFTGKLHHYPAMAHIALEDLDVSGFHAVRERLSCRPFAWFLWRFKEIYEDAGLLPEETFKLQHRSGLCLTYLGPAGTHPQGHDKVELLDCAQRRETPWVTGPLDPQRWHLANRDDRGRCCSGFRAWNTDQCLSSVGDPGTHICEVSGRSDQLWRLTGSAGKERFAAGQLVWGPHGVCLTRSKKGRLLIAKCKERSDKEGKAPSLAWQKVAVEVPLETTLYKQAKQQQPELFREPRYSEA